MDSSKNWVNADRLRIARQIEEMAGWRSGPVHYPSNSCVLQPFKRHKLKIYQYRSQHKFHLSKGLS